MLVGTLAGCTLAGVDPGLTVTTLILQPVDPAELVLRTITAGMGVAAFVILVYALATRVYAARSIFLFMAVVVGLNAIWRLFLVWIGATGLTADMRWLYEFLGPINSVLTFLLLFAIALASLFQIVRHRRDAAFIEDVKAQRDGASAGG